MYCCHPGLLFWLLLFQIRKSLGGLGSSRFCGKDSAKPVFTVSLVLYCSDEYVYSTAPSGLGQPTQYTASTLLSMPTQWLLQAHLKQQLACTDLCKALYWLSTLYAHRTSRNLLTTVEHLNSLPASSLLNSGSCNHYRASLMPSWS